MDLYRQIDDSIQLFIEHMFEDVKHLLQHRYYYHFVELKKDIQQKYTFYDFEKDPIKLFDTWLDNLESRLILKARELLNIQRVDSPTIDDYYNHIYSTFHTYLKNDILDLSRCQTLDLTILHKQGQYKKIDYFYPNYQPKPGNTIFDTNTGEFIGYVSNVGLFTFDIVQHE